MSTITLYKNCKVLEGKNFQVDSFSNYLNSLDSTYKKTYNNCKYVKTGLNTQVKVTLDEDTLDPVANNYNYCDIVDGTGHFYYFINKMEWCATKCILLTLKLDVLNTYNGKYTLTNKTLLLRQHKDRWVNNAKLALTKNYSYRSEDLDWGTLAGEQVGIIEQNLPEEWLNRNYTCTYIISGTSPDIIQFAYEPDSPSFTLKCFVQGEETPIPTFDIAITVTSAAVAATKSVRIVDFQNESINPVLFKKDSAVAYDSNIKFGGNKEDSYYLYYRTSNAAGTDQSFLYNNPVNVFFGSDSGITATTEGELVINIGEFVQAHQTAGFICFPTGNASRGTVLPNSFEEDYPNPEATLTIKVYYRLAGEEADTFNHEDYIQLKRADSSKDRNKQRALRFGGSWIEFTWLKRDNIEQTNGASSIRNVQAIKFKNITKIKVFTTMGVPWNPFPSNNWTDLLVRNPGASYEYTGRGESNFVSLKLNEVRTTESEWIKILKLPYCPVTSTDSFTWNPQQKLFKIDWKNALYLTKNITQETSEGITNPVAPMYTNKIIPNLNILRNDFYESKLYNSEFYVNKLVYDNSSYDFKLEELNTPEYTDAIKNFNYNFVVSTNATSAFLFDFKNSFPLKTSITAYDNIMLVNRNVEIPIYNNYYLNYLRNGYNYDQANKRTSAIGGAVGTAAGIATTVAGIVTAAVGPKGVGAGMIVSGVAATAASVTSAVNSSVQADRAIQEKMEQARTQATNIEGNNDMGLVSYYTKEVNKPEFMVFEVSENTKHRVADLFYYCGYACNYQATPNTNSRKWFNFVQCEPVFDQTSTDAYLSDEVKKELINKYKEGVTVLHKPTTTWDFDQVKENWEVSLFN